jgi:CheY-like chemotaxis protein
MTSILIVEDDSGIRELLTLALEDEGFTVVAVNDGYAALAAIEAACPDCILLDLNMPLLDGHGVLDALSGRDIRPPVLLMTSDPRGSVLGPADGVVGHIPKPFDLDYLSSAVALVAQAGSHQYR